MVQIAIVTVENLKIFEMNSEVRTVLKIIKGLFVL